MQLQVDILLFLMLSDEFVRMHFPLYFALIILMIFIIDG